MQKIPARAKKARQLREVLIAAAVAVNFGAFAVYS